MAVHERAARHRAVPLAWLTEPVSDVTSAIELVNVKARDIQVPGLGTCSIQTGQPLAHAVTDLLPGVPAKALCGTAKRRLTPMFWSWWDLRNDERFDRCSTCLRLYPWSLPTGQT